MYRHNQLLEAMIRNVGNNGRFDNHVTEYVCELDVIASHGKIKEKRRMNLIVSTARLAMRKLSCNTTRRIDRFLFRLCEGGPYHLFSRPCSHFYPFPVVRCVVAALKRPRHWGTISLQVTWPLSSSQTVQHCPLAVATRVAVETNTNTQDTFRATIR